MLLPTKVVYLADFIKQMVESMWLLNLSCFIPGPAGFDQDYGEKSSECLSFLQTLLHQDSLFFRALVWAAFSWVLCI